MATLEKIRKRGVLLVIVIGVALLSFIIGDFLTQGSTFFNKSRETVAEINGEKINIRDYQDLLDQITVFQKYETGSQDIDEQTTQQLRAFVWDQLIREKILMTEAQKIGLEIDKEELSDQLIGNNIHPMIQQRRFFADESGRFNRMLLLQFLNFKDDEPTDYQMQEVLNEYKMLWMFLERTVKIAMLQEKYNNLISNVIFANNLQAKDNFTWSLKSADVNYLVKPYYAVSDAEFVVSDKEIKERYNQQISQYRQEPNASIKFVSFAIEPQEEDYTEAEEFINSLKEEFYKEDDVMELVNMNSDIPYTGQNYSEKTVPPHYKDFAFSGKKGDAIGPMFVNNTYTMAKIMETGIMLPDSVKLRHIFLLPENESKADSIIRAIRGKADFGELARKYSAVRQTAENDGEIGWIVDGAEGLDKNILQDAFAKRVHEVFTFKSPQGTQIIQIMEKTAPKKKVKLAILERNVIASTKTQSKIFNDAKRFAAGLKAADFDSVALKNNYNVRHANEIRQSNENVLNIPRSRQVVRWAFENSKGAVSDVFECDQEIIVAVLTDISTSKYQPVDKVASLIRGEIVRDKKAEQFTKEINDALSKGSSLEEVAKSLNLEIKSAERVNFNSYQFGSEGFEPAVIGKALSQTEGQLSQAIKGNAGIFVVRTTNVQQQESDFDLATEQQNIISRYRYSFPNMVLMDLRNQSDIEDNRLRFY
ncbi:MAG: peptidylprolyl isomerase [Bacteroidetes bacterium ADurb.Bin174]|jgi:peptidyl-prolyl cis-trans isomerase D|nr:MAG: peptidylprolyl isomerase [Bacteroidetes bacterium ADurb.Bin174]